MEPIVVPKPPASAFNKHRPPSDLLQSQLKYFQHLDEKYERGLDPALRLDLGTEAGAARYIAQMTRAIRSRKQGAPMGLAAVPSTGTVRRVRNASPPRGMSDGLALAAASAEAPPAVGKKSKARQPKRKKT